ncbi:MULTISPECIES: SRPBCC family protein [Mumia]|uniref:SRPBCC family protein n=1 Tax=Mumia TaxID=1546255 RepID=UPI001422E89B|nr:MULTISPECIES: carbon monoxide dehydrogenase subunit G [unclassified Mumia]QMW67293.1 carbon monoxide dehydrogenase subunit G [Mumia sp. ZJ1417]
MKVAGQAVLNAPVDAVWTALLDPAVLVRTIPGCEVLEATGENAYAMTVSAGVASIRGTYAGTCTLSDLVPHQSLVMRAEGAGAPGTVAADVAVRFSDNGDGTTGVAYAADAVVGGMIGGVGQRMLTAVSKRMAGEFFGAVDDAIASSSLVEGGSPSVEPVETPAVGQRFTAPAPAAGGRSGSTDDFVKGAVLGGVLVLAGVIVGGLFGRRSR